MSISVESLGYAFAALGLLLFTALILVSYRNRLRGALLALACGLSGIWASIYAYAAVVGGSLSLTQIAIAEFTFDAAWLAYLASLLTGAVGGLSFQVLRSGGTVLALLALVVVIVVSGSDTVDESAAAAAQILVFGQILTSLAGLVYVEQIYRNARSNQRRDLKYLCLGVGLIFAFDLIIYTSAILIPEAQSVLWSSRGYVVAMVIPLIGIAVKRSPDWSGGIFVSRQIVFHTTVVVAAGAYLLLVGLGGEAVKRLGGDAGKVAQAVFMSAAIVALITILVSDNARSRLKVFVSKHFYENKYDYRVEWLRLISTLTEDEERLPLQKRCLKAFTQILDADQALLWTKPRSTDAYQCTAGWNCNITSEVFDQEATLPAFLGRTGWVVDSVELREHPDRYGKLKADNLVNLFPESPSLVVPLFHGSELLGFVVVGVSSSGRPLNYEDRDLLKTVGRQVASFLAQEKATEELTEGRQFEAFNRLTAFLMHDLKNVIAQQLLIVENAEKHKSNPEFIDDALQTINLSVKRMQKILDDLRRNRTSGRKDRVDLSKVVLQAVSDCEDRSPVPKARVDDQPTWVLGDKDRLYMAICHGIRNAQDATSEAGIVEVSVDQTSSEYVVTILDSGKGMDPNFVRYRLFKPFDSTKGPQGMGIGAYQIRETAASMGGRVDIESEPGKGTRVIIRLMPAPAGNPA